MAAPSVVTDPASSIGETQATLNGRSTWADATAPISYTLFEWGETSSYGNFTPYQQITTAATQYFTAIITGLKSATSYHYRIRGYAGGAVSYGADTVFTTMAPPAPTGNFTFGIGKGLAEPCSPYRQANVFGADLNTPSASGWNCPATLVESTATFDLTQLSPNHEVVVALLTLRDARAGATAIRFRWFRDRDRKLLFEYVWNISAIAGGWFYAYSFIGRVDWEIAENGLYLVEVEVSGANSFSRGIYLTALGIRPIEPEPPPVAAWAAAIPSAFNDVADGFYQLYLTARGWIWPFNYSADLFYAVSVVFRTLAAAFTDFLAVVNGLLSQLPGILSWATIWSYITSNVPNLEAIRDWFYGWVSSVLGVVVTWWAVTKPTLLSWIADAKSWTQSQLNTLQATVLSLLSDFRGWTQSQLNDIRAMLPALFDWGALFSWITDWWANRLLDVQGLINSAFLSRESWWAGWRETRSAVFEFLTNPVGYIWDRFLDWFLEED